MARPQCLALSLALLDRGDVLFFTFFPFNSYIISCVGTEVACAWWSLLRSLLSSLGAA